LISRARSKTTLPIVGMLKREPTDQWRAQTSNPARSLLVTSNPERVWPVSIGAADEFCPHLNVSYRGEKGKTTGYYVPKAAQEATREGVAAWQKMQECLRELAELNKERNLQSAREAD